MERWLPVVIRGNRTIVGYEVSDRGRVRTYWQKAGPSPRLAEKPTLRRIALTKARGSDRGGTPVVCLRLARARSYTFPVHELVARAFLGHAPQRGWQIIHVNHERTDNRATNLKWVSRSHASLHAIKARPRRPLAKLTPTIVRQNRKSTELTRVLARRFGVNNRAVYDVRWGRTWRDVV